MKRSILAILIPIVIVAALAVGSYMYIRSHGFSALDEPNMVEDALAKRVRYLAIPRAAREAANPVTASPEVLSEATAHFADHCAICHANDGSGNTPIGKGLYPKPPDMRTGATQDMTDGELYYIIHNGIRFTGMPGFGQGSSNNADVDSWKLVHFIRRLPHLTAEEVERMKALNPKSPADLKEEEELERFLRGEDTAPSDNDHKHD